LRRGGGLELSSLADVEIRERLGEGLSCVVYDAVWKGRPVAAKLYKASAVDRHHAVTGTEIAEYEYERNAALRAAPGVEPYVAEPLAFLSTAGVSMFLQERLDGELYYDYYVRLEGRVDPSLLETLQRVVAAGNEAGLYDLDVHAGNTMLVSDAQGDSLRPVLFDFNAIPFFDKPPNPFAWAAFRLGVIGRDWRDRNKIANFHDFSSYRRKLARYGPPAGAVSSETRRD
jgi:hypothetical protein